jgi:hypothetical protein
VIVLEISSEQDGELDRLGDLAKLLAQRDRKFYANKVAIRIEIVFAGLVDDANEIVLSGERVLQYWVEFSELERGWIAIVGNAYRELLLAR